MKKGIWLFLLSVGVLWGAKGSVLIECGQEGAYIFVNGKKKAMTGTRPTTIKLEEGEHLISIEKEEEEWVYRGEKKIFVGEDTTTQISIDTERTPTQARKERLLKEEQARKVKIDAKEVLKQKLTKYVYGGYDSDNFESVIEDGENLVLAGNTYSKGNGSSDAWIIKQSKNGKILWNKTYGGKEYDALTEMVKLSNGNYVFVGRTRSYSKNEKIWLVTVSPEGKMLRKTFYTIKNFNEITGMAASKNGDIALVGTTRYKVGKGFFDSASSTFVICVNKKGKRKWTKLYKANKRENSFYAYSINSTNQGYVITGAHSRKKKGESILGYQDYIVMNIDKKGKELWRRTLKSYNITEILGSYAAIETKNGDIVSTGFDGRGGDAMRTIVVRMDKKGSIKWKKLYGGNHINHGIGKALRELDDGSLLVSGEITYKQNDNDTHFNIFKIDAEGNELWQKSYGGKNQSMPKDMIVTKEGTIAIVGWTYSFGEMNENDRESNAWLIHLDNTGNLK